MAVMPLPKAKLARDAWFEEMRDAALDGMVQRSAKLAGARDLASGRRKRRARPHGRRPAPESRREAAYKRSLDVNLPALDRVAARAEWCALAGEAVGGPGVLGGHVQLIARAQAAGDVLALEDALLGAAAGLAFWLDQLADRRRQIAA